MGEKEMNISLELLNNTKEEVCLLAEQCLEACKELKIQTSYEFVWLFVVGFMFLEGSSLAYTKKIDLKPELRTAIARGMKITGYLLNMIGIIWLLVIL